MKSPALGQASGRSLPIFFLIFLYLAGCAHSEPYMQTAPHVDLKKFMGNWYVLAGRFTPFETGVHNALETYSWNEDKEQIDIGFTYNQGALDGKLRSIPQTGWVEDKQTNAHWKVRPFWPLKFDYLVLDRADDYSWTAIGVPSQKYLWIMARDWKNPNPTRELVLKRLKAKGYNTEDVVVVPHRWPRAAAAR